MKYIMFRLSFDQGWLNIILSTYIRFTFTVSYILVLTFFFANEQHWNLWVVLVFANFHLLQSNLMPQDIIILVYSLFVKLCHSLTLKFCQAGNLKTRYINLKLMTLINSVSTSLQRNLSSFNDFFWEEYKSENT